MKFSPYQSDQTVSEWQMPCLHYALQHVDDVTCSCCHVEGLQSVGHMLGGLQWTALAFTGLFFCLLGDAFCSNNLVLCVAVGAGSVLHLDWKKELEENRRNKGRKKEEWETENRKKERKHFRKEWHGTETRRPLKPADNPTDWFHHIRDGSESLSGRAEYVSAR